MTTPSNFKQVYKIFSAHYVEIPLEVFGRNPYKTLVSTLMSARTRDEVTLVAAQRLFKKAPGFETLRNLDTEELKKLIYPVGFYNTKAKNLKGLAEVIHIRFGGSVPKTREELMSLPGVGRKTANLVLNRAFGIPAIAVDTHVHKISNLLGWANTKDPLKTELILNDILPQSYWSDINRLFVSIGRQYSGSKKLQEFLKKENLI